VWAGTETIGIKYPTNTNSSFVVADPDYIFTSRLYDVHLYTAGHRLSASRKRELTYRIGVHLGQLDNTQAADFNARVLPELLVAYGNRRLLFGQGDLGYGAENALGNYTARLALGSGLGQRYGSTVLLGYAESYHYPSRNMGFVSANLRIPGHSALSGLSLEPYFATDFDRHQQFSLKLHYQLGLR
jgi:phosphatidylglycerol:prolipoprotein diacylglycerol transferase